MKFLAVEHVLPGKVVTNEDVLERLARENSAHLSSSDLQLLLRWTEQCFKSARTSVRYHRADSERAADLACKAGNNALARSGLSRDEIDLLIYVGIGRGTLEPCAASVFQDMLGLRRATCFDVLDACAGWMRGLHVAHAFLASGTYKNVMLLNAEFMAGEMHHKVARLADFVYWHPTVTMGDAATATNVSRDERESRVVASFRTSGYKRDLCFVPLPWFSSYFGKELDTECQHEPLHFISYGARLLEVGARKLIEHVSTDADFSGYRPDTIFGHSASDGIAEYVLRNCGYDPTVYDFSHDRFANTASASIPLAMSVAIREGRLVDGNRVLLMMASAGITTGLVRFSYRAG